MTEGDDLKLYILSASLTKQEPEYITQNMTQGYRLSRSENEAKGEFLTSINDTKPGFAISQFLCMEIPPQVISKAQSSKPLDTEG